MVSDTDKANISAALTAKGDGCVPHFETPEDLVNILENSREPDPRFHLFKKLIAEYVRDKMRNYGGVAPRGLQIATIAVLRLLVVGPRFAGDEQYVSLCALDGARYQQLGQQAMNLIARLFPGEPPQTLERDDWTIIRYEQSGKGSIYDWQPPVRTT